MKMKWLTDQLCWLLVPRYYYKNPNEEIYNTKNDLYLNRYYVIPKNKYFNIYIHEFLGDDTRELHNHPWYSLGFILRGGYTEVTPYNQPKYTSNNVFATIYKKLKTGEIKFRSPNFTHYINHILPNTWTLFVTGPNIREWGFYTKDGQYVEHNI